MKKTALDWLLEQIYSDEYQRAFGKTYISIAITEQAKEMEKEQIIEAFFEGKNDGILMERYSDYKHISPNEYYNETFES